MLRTIRSAAAVTVAAFLTAGALAAVAAPASADVAPNGVIAYSAWDDELNYDIYTVDPATPDAPPLRLTTDGRYNGNPDWSPDGTRIAYDGWGTTMGPRIAVMDTDPATDDHVVLTEACIDDLDCYGDFQPAWSPDGTRIAFVSSRPNADGSDNWSYEIYVMDATGEVGALPQATRLTTDVKPEFGGGIEDSQVTWSPDGSRVTFLSEGRGDDIDACDLWAMDSYDRDGDGFGDDLQRLTFDETWNCDAFGSQAPEWAPNSNLIVFTSVRNGNYDVWIVNADDPTDLRNVTNTPAIDEDQASWSPDGTQIVFRSYASGAYEYYSLPVPPAAAVAGVGVVAAPAARPKQLTFDGVDKADADWGAQEGARAGTVTLGVTDRRHGKITTAANRTKINCGTDCTATYVEGARVTLKAAPAAGYAFVRWTGACEGRAATCKLQLTDSTTVGAKFRATG